MSLFDAEYLRNGTRYRHSFNGILVGTYTRHVIIKGDNTYNSCSIDLSKVFDKVNHFGLYLKLMKRRIPAVNYLLFLKTGSQVVLPVLDGMEHGHNVWYQLWCKTRISSDHVLVLHLSGPSGQT